MAVFHEEQGFGETGFGEGVFGDIRSVDSAKFDEDIIVGGPSGYSPSWCAGGGDGVGHGLLSILNGLLL